MKLVQHLCYQHPFTNPLIDHKYHLVEVAGVASGCAECLCGWAGHSLAHKPKHNSSAVRREVLFRPGVPGLAKGLRVFSRGQLRLWDGLHFLGSGMPSTAGKSDVSQKASFPPGPRGRSLDPRMALPPRGSKVRCPL